MHSSCPKPKMLHLSYTIHNGIMIFLRQHRKKYENRLQRHIPLLLLVPTTMSRPSRFPSSSAWSFSLPLCFPSASSDSPRRGRSCSGPNRLRDCSCSAPSLQAPPPQPLVPSFEPARLRLPLTSSRPLVLSSEPASSAFAAACAALSLQGAQDYPPPRADPCHRVPLLRRGSPANSGKN
jgi:hypothetical protein